MNYIVFDMDGILFDTERISHESFKEIAAERGLPFEAQVLIDCIGKNRTDILAHLCECYGENFPAEEYLNLTVVRMHEKIERDGLPIMKGAVDLLDGLKAGGWHIGLASSSGRKMIAAHLTRAGLDGYFEQIIGGDMVEHSKPQPDIYVKACELLGSKPEKTIAIEDSPNGIRAAYGAGMKPIMVPDMIKPTAEISAMLYRECESLDEVREMLL